MRILALILVITVSCVSAQRISYTNFKVYKVFPGNEQHLEILGQLENNRNVDFWTELQRLPHPLNIMVSPTFQREFETILSKNMINFYVLIEDVETIVNHETLYQQKAPQNLDGEISFAKYHRYSEIQDYLHRQSNKYPDLVSLENYGTSYENRTLTLIRISSGGNAKKPLIFVDAGIHAREWIAPAQALYLIHQLLENPDHKNLIQNIDWVVIPLLNPDGYEYTHEVDRFWRKTRSKGKQCDGVDPNRNFDYHWLGPGSSDEECSTTYAGPSAFSEPETLALSRVIKTYANRTALYLTLHSAAQCLLYPWGYTAELPDNAQELHNLAAEAERAISAVHGTHYKIGSSTNTLAPASGSSRDWAKGAAEIDLSYTVELPPGGDQGFDLPPDKILGVVQEIFEGIKVFYEYVEQKFMSL